MGRVVWSKQLVVRWPFLAALVVALLLGCVLSFPGFLVDLALRPGQRLLPPERVKAVNDVRTTLLQGLAGLVLLFGAIATWRQLQTSKQELHLSREGQITERFTKAIDQLDYKKSLEVRLGAIYALERIAWDSERDHWPIMEVLTTYVRQHAPWSAKTPFMAALRALPAYARQGEAPPKPKPAADIQAILTVLGRRRLSFENGKNQRLDLRATDLRGASLAAEAHLEGAHLEKAHLEGAHLVEAHLESAHLEEAHLEGAHLEEAHLENASLSDAHLEKARLDGAYFMIARLKKAHLEEAHLEHADLQHAHLEGAHLEHAHLEGADLRDALGLTQQQIDSAITDENTKLPDYLAPPPARPT